MLEKLGMSTNLPQTKSDGMTPEMMTFVKQKTQSWIQYHG
jgi:hypothetical protein